MIRKTNFIITLTSLMSLLFFSFHYSFGLTDSPKDHDYNDLFQRYLDWWVNLPSNVASDSNVYECIYHIDNGYIFLIDPYGKIEIKSDCEFPQKHIFFSLLYGWCDTGNKEIYAKPLKDILECLGPINSGSYYINTKFDGKEIINAYIKIDDDNNWKILKNDFPENANLKVIDIKNFFDLTVTNMTRYINDYEHPEDFERNPINYKAVGLCICGIIDSSLLTPGEHKLEYKISSIGTHSDIKPTRLYYDIAIK